MAEPTTHGAAWRRLAVPTAAWSGVALFFVTQNVVTAAVRGVAIDWYFALVVELMYWLVWLLVTPVLLFAARTWRFEPEERMRSVGMHVLVMASVSVGHVAVYSALQYGAARWPGNWAADELVRLPAQLRRAVPALLFTAFYKYWAVIGVLSAVNYYRRYREKELAAEGLAAQLAEARLEALRSQLHPHFLFNALNTVSMLVVTDPPAAGRVVVRLSELLRRALAQPASQLVPLESELDFVDRYLEIERLRFGERLATEYEVDDALLQAEVPALVLQPLVENAVRHGVGAVAGQGAVSVRARVAGGRLVLEVEDNGPGMPPRGAVRQASGGGVGLANLGERLQALYGGDHRIEFRRPAGGGACVRLTIPLHLRTS